MEFLAYLSAVRKHWWPLMSCALFTGLGMWIFYADKNNAWSIRATFGIAGFCLFWAGYRAWSEERSTRLSLEKPALTLKETLLQLSRSVLEFIYERAPGAPKISPTPRFGGFDGGTEWLESLEKFNHEQHELTAYHKDTLGLYDARYKRSVAEAIASLKNLGLDAGALEQCASDLSNESEPENTGSPRVSIPIDEWIKAVGKNLGILADQIKET